MGKLQEVQRVGLQIPNPEMFSLPEFFVAHKKISPTVVLDY